MNCMKKSSVIEEILRNIAVLIDGRYMDDKNNGIACVARLIRKFMCGSIMKDTVMQMNRTEKCNVY